MGAGPGDGKAVVRAGRGSGLGVVGALCSQGALLAVVVLVARQGALDVGRYTTAVATTSLLVLVALGGFRAALTRFAAVHLAEGDGARLRGLLLLALGLSGAGSLLAALALAAGAPALADALGDPALVPLLRLAAAALPGAVLAEALLAATQGWRTQRAHALVGKVMEPALRLGLTALALAVGAGTTGAVAALVVSSWTSALVAAVVLRRWVRRAAPAPARVVEVRAVLAFSGISWVATMAASGLVWADVLLLGALTDQSQVGVYAVATRLAALVVLAGPPVVGAAAPHLAHLLHVGDLAEAGRVYASATRWTLVLALPAAVVVARHPQELLGVVGPGFTGAAAVTLVLLVGHLVGAAAGPCTALLTMAGRVRLSMLVNVAVLVLDVLLVLALVPRLGALGAALAWAVALVVGNTAKWVLARSVVGVRAGAEGLGRLAVATGAAGVAAAGVGSLVETGVGAVVLTAPVTLLVFLAVLLVLGLPGDDRALAADVVRRVRRRDRSRGRPNGQGEPRTGEAHLGQVVATSSGARAGGPAGHDACAPPADVTTAERGLRVRPGPEDELGHGRGRGPAAELGTTKEQGKGHGDR
ncbi:lipopolysaccharide biosynthesis protein [Pseudokineococcus sp. 1T1Z-3]|uniref:lipopolysaccharide biosynthesis protein n=1 Tax=Pseudokineococcus sp. 1T1Z-3 TaxID=3132745 RepID=UPI0030B04406